MTKGQLILQKRLQTRQRHKKQTIKVFQVKVDKSRLNMNQTKHLKMIFVEARWLYNHILSQPDIFKIDTKLTTVQVKVADKFETRQINYLSSQMKQDIVFRTQKSIVGLSRLKKNGRKIGALKFKQRIYSIPLRQHKQTFYITSPKTIRLQGMKKSMKVLGLEQIHDNAEIANAVLINRHGDYFIKITCYLPKESPTSSKLVIGTDTGIKTQLTLSNGIAIKYTIPISSRVKGLQKRISRQKKGSKNREKSKLKLEKEHAHLNNKKKDIHNKIVHGFKIRYRYMPYQNDCLKGWQKLWGKKILETSVGGLMSTLKKCVHTPIEVDRFSPTTQRCSECKARQPMELSKRVFVCRNCGFVINRDLNSAINIRNEGLEKLTPTERRGVPVETGASTLAFLEYLNNIPYVKASLVCEAGSPSPLGYG